MKYFTFIMGAVIFSGLVVSSVQAEEILRPDMSTRIEQKQLQAEIIQERMKAIQDIQQQRIDNAEEIKARMMQVTDAYKQKKDVLQDVRLQTQERIEKEKTIMMERRAEMAAKLHSRTVFGFESAVQQMSGFLDRALERVIVMQDAGMDVKEAQSLIADIQTRITAIKNSLQVLSTLAITIENSGFDPSELNEELRLQHATFIDSAKEIRSEVGSLRELFEKLLPLLKSQQE